MSDEAGEPSRGTLRSKGRRRESEPSEGMMGETTSSPTISTKLDRIAKLARDFRGKPLNPLSHFIDEEWLHEAHRLTRKDGALGVDRQGALQYAENLEENLRSLLARAKSGTYRAPPVRRVHIPKGDGSQTRPIGIPTFEDPDAGNLHVRICGGPAGQPAGLPGNSGPGRLRSPRVVRAGLAALRCQPLAASRCQVAPRHHPLTPLAPRPAASPSHGAVCSG